MTTSQQDAFYAASGIEASGLNADIRLFVGGLAIVVAILILGGLMHLIDSASPWDKIVFLISVSGLSFILMVVFIYVA